MENDIRDKIRSIDSKIKTLRKEREEITKKIHDLEDEKTSLKNKLELNGLNLNKRDWANEKFSFSNEVQSVLEEKFKLKELRVQQKAAINALLNGKNVLLLMPTGGGKSLCYQLPSLITKGVTIVVSPLVSLMEDQIYQLKRLNIKAYAMSSNTSNEDKKKVFDFLNKGQGERIHLIYVTPEWLAKSKRFMAALQKIYASKKLDRFAIDEVHCVSTWGHDFRPDYTYLSLLKNMFKDVPIIGLTATATSNVLIDVKSVLDIQDAILIKAPFDRPNLKFIVLKKPDKSEECIDYLIDLIKSNFDKKSGIIYTATIKDCQELALILRKKGGLNCRPYHAEMDKEKRKTVHESWLKNEVLIVIGTVAFGMGIDKADVRFVIHFTLPKSMESLYQEAGRAGRDGKKAECLILFRLNDYLKQSAYSNSKEQIKNVKHILEYCLDLKRCRHLQIAKHFEEMEEKEVKGRNCCCEKMCDNCCISSSATNLEQYDVTSYVKNVIFDCIKKQTVLENNLTLKKLIDLITKKEYSNKYSSLKVEHFEYIIGCLIKLGFIQEERNYTSYSINTYLKINNEDCFNKRIVICMIKESILDRYFLNSSPNLSNSHNNKKRKIILIESSDSD